jgi:hypothetical protein
VRVTYMDESRSSPRDQLIVVAAIIVHGDEQVVPVEDYLEELVDKHIPDENRFGFYFHATDIYHGGGKKCLFHDKEKWPDERRYRILDDLVAVPTMFGLPICFGFIDKSEFPFEPTNKSHPKNELSVAAHAMAIIYCEMGVEVWLRNKTEKETTHIVAENNTEVQSAAKEAHTLLRNPHLSQMERLKNHTCFPFKRIRDGLQFTSKEESRLLQVADVSASSKYCSLRS